jgi:hypothetical protein
MSLVIIWDNVKYIFVCKHYGHARMGNPETKATLGYDIVQRQSNERQLKDEHGPHRKKRLTQVLANVGDNGCFF